MDTKQRAELSERLTALEERGHSLRARLTLNPDLSARYVLDDEIADLGEDIADLRRLAA